MLTWANFPLLFGAAMLAAPIILHLIMRRQPKHLEFPALRFLQAKSEAIRRTLRLRHLLLLLLRCAAIALLATALAGPSVKSIGFIGDQEAPVAAAMIFDTSPRMEYRRDNQTRLEAAQETALWLLPQLPSKSDVAVIEGTGAGAGAVFQVDVAAARQRIERLESTAVSPRLLTLIDQAVELLKTKGEQRKELYVFTDLTRGAWAGETAASLQSRIQELTDLGVYVVDVGVAEPKNFALGDVRLTAESVSKNSPVRLRTELSHSGPASERTVELYLLDPARDLEDRAARKVDQTTVAAVDGGAQTVEFVRGGLPVGTHQGYVRIVGEDNLAIDDTRYFTIEVTPAWRVLLLAPKPAGDYARYLAEALAPLALEKNDQARFRCDVRALDELENLDLAPYAAIAVLDPPPLTEARWRKLRDHTMAGGGLAIFLGRNAQARDSFNQPFAQEVLPGKLQSQIEAPNNGTVQLTSDTYEHALLTRFRPIQSTVPWGDCPVFQYWKFEQLHESARVVLNFSDGSPALVERPLGDGSVLVLATPVSDGGRRDAWNLLLIQDGAWPGFMLVNEMTLHLVGSATEKLNYLVGDRARLRRDADSTFSTFRVTPPRGDPFPVQVDPRENAIFISATDRPGSYGVRAGGEDTGVNRGFSVNLRPGDTDLERTGAETLDAVFGAKAYRWARNRDEISRDISLGRVGRELYPYLIVIFVVLLALEQIVSNRFYAERK